MRKHVNMYIFAARVRASTPPPGQHTHTHTHTHTNMYARAHTPHMRALHMTIALCSHGNNSSVGLYISNTGMCIFTSSLQPAVLDSCT